MTTQWGCWTFSLAYIKPFSWIIIIIFRIRLIRRCQNATCYNDMKNSQETWNDSQELTFGTSSRSWLRGLSLYSKLCRQSGSRAGRMWFLSLRIRWNSSISSGALQAFEKPHTSINFVNFNTVIAVTVHISIFFRHHVAYFCGFFEKLGVLSPTLGSPWPPGLKNPKVHIYVLTICASLTATQTWWWWETCSLLHRDK